MSEQVNLNKYMRFHQFLLLAGTTTGFFFLPFPVWDLSIHPGLCLLLLGLWLVQHGVFFLVFPCIMLMDIVAELFNGAYMGKVCLRKEALVTFAGSIFLLLVDLLHLFLAKTNFAHIFLLK